MNPGLWILVIAVGIVLAVVILFFVLPSIFAGLLVVKEWIVHMRYARQARKHNEKARLLRLSRTEWNGFPLPTGKEGTLRITYDQLVKSPERFSTTQFERTYFDRARDMHVELEYMHDPITRDIVVRWKPLKGKRPKEKY